MRGSIPTTSAVGAPKPPKCFSPAGRCAPGPPACRDHLRKHVDRGAAVIELTSAVVRHVDDIDSMLAGERRILGRGDALEHQGDPVTVLEPLDLVPGERCLVLRAGR